MLFINYHYHVSSWFGILKGIECHQVTRPSLPWPEGWAQPTRWGFRELMRRLYKYPHLGSWERDEVWIELLNILLT